MTVYFGNMNLPVFGQVYHTTSCLSYTLKCCVFCYQHVDSSTCSTVRTWSERMFQVRQKRLCKICLSSHYSNAFCHAGRKPCQYCGALKKHHESVCPKNPFLDENKISAPTTEKEASIDDGLQETLKMLTDKGLCHKCLGRHRTETCKTWLRCQTCDSGYHHHILCPKSSSSPSDSNTDAPSPTSEDEPMSPAPLPLDLAGSSLKSDADLSTFAESYSEDDTASSRCSTPSSETSDNSSVVWESPDSPVLPECRWEEAYQPSSFDDEVKMDQAEATDIVSPSTDTPALCPSAQPTKPSNDDGSTNVSPGKSKCWFQNLRRSRPESTSLPEAEKDHLFVDHYSMEYCKKMYEELLSCDNVIDNEMAASPLSTHQAVDIDTRNWCSYPSSEASDDSFVMWQAPDSTVPSECQWEDSCSPSSFDDDDGVEMDRATDVKSAVRLSNVSTNTPALCPSSDSTKPSNLKTHLDILFSGGCIEDVACPESSSDNASADISNDKVNSWLQSLRNESPESTSSSTAKKECHTCDDNLSEYYYKMYAEVSKICERAATEPQHYNYYYYCYNYYVYYFYASVYQWLAANASNFDASAGEANVAVLSQPIDNESRNRCSSPSSEASEDSFVMWQSPDSPVPSDCRWDETYSPSFDEDFDNDMDV